MDIHKAFQYGAKKLAAAQGAYTDLHKGHGIEEHEWKILTQEEYWSADQARMMRATMSNVVEVSMTIAGMPAIPMPGQYVAAVIAEVVAPPNRMLACMKAPDTFDAADASGLLTTHEVKEMSKEQLMSLVLAYSGDLTGEPPAHRLPKQMATKIAEVNEK